MNVPANSQTSWAGMGASISEKPVETRRHKEASPDTWLLPISRALPRPGLSAWTTHLGPMETGKTPLRRDSALRGRCFLQQLGSFFAEAMASIILARPARHSRPPYSRRHLA